jgi:hypothetical protein
MGQLIKIDKPEEGGDPLKLWQTLCDIIDALNYLSVTIVPGELASVRIQEGDIQISFNPPPPSSPTGSDSSGSQPTSGAGTAGPSSGGSTN